MFEKFCAGQRCGASERFVLARDMVLLSIVVQARDVALATSCW